VSVRLNTHQTHETLKQASRPTETRKGERCATDGLHSGFCGQQAAAAVAESEPPLSLARRLAQQFQGEVVTSRAAAASATNTNTAAAPSSFMTALVAGKTETAVETSLGIGKWGCSGGGDGDPDATGASPPAVSRGAAAAGTLGSLSPPPTTTLPRASPPLGSDSPPSLASPLPGGVLCR
jgi:hypothetical protein